jgi:uncharacterized MAPEG superfamily protein
MESTLSERQVEARTTGEQKKSVEFLNQNHFLAIMVFVVAIITANLWTETTVSLIAVIFGVNREQIKIWMWLISAIIFTLIAYVIIRYIIKVPLTAAFSF